MVPCATGDTACIKPDRIGPLIRSSLIVSLGSLNISIHSRIQAPRRNCLTAQSYWTKAPDGSTSTGCLTNVPLHQGDLQKAKMPAGCSVAHTSITALPCTDACWIGLLDTNIKIKFHKSIINPLHIYHGGKISLVL